MGHSSVWEVRDCRDQNQRRRRTRINQSGETEAGSVTLLLLPCAPHPAPAPVPCLGGDSGAPGLCFLELSAALRCAEFPGKIPGLLLIALLRHGVVPTHLG